MKKHRRIEWDMHWYKYRRICIGGTADKRVGLTECSNFEFLQLLLLFSCIKVYQL